MVQVSQSPGPACQCGPRPREPEPDPGPSSGRAVSELSVSLQTDYFHLFICVAIVAIYGDDVIEQQLATDQMLLHFGNLAMHMNGELVLRKVGTVLVWPVRPGLHISRPCTVWPHPCP